MLHLELKLAIFVACVCSDVFSNISMLMVVDPHELVAGTPGKILNESCLSATSGTL
jgi:hypothetical protein